jgi:hypothetical protein
LAHVDEEWNHDKELTEEIAEHTAGYQLKPDNRRWFDEECKIATDEKNVTYNKWINRPTRSKTLDYVCLWKIARKICINKK